MTSAHDYEESDFRFVRFFSLYQYVSPCFFASLLALCAAAVRVFKLTAAAAAAVGLVVAPLARLTGLRVLFLLLFCGSVRTY